MALNSKTLELRLSTPEHSKTGLLTAEISAPGLSTLDAGPTVTPGSHGEHFSDIDEKVAVSATFAESDDHFLLQEDSSSTPEPGSPSENVSNLCRSCWDMTWNDEDDMRWEHFDGFWRNAFPRTWEALEASCEMGCPISLPIKRHIDVHWAQDSMLLDVVGEMADVFCWAKDSELIFVGQDTRTHPWQHSSAHPILMIVTNSGMDLRLGSRSQSVFLPLCAYKDGLEPGISQYQCSEALAPGNLAVRKAIRDKVKVCLSSHDLNGLPYRVDSSQRQHLPLLPSRVLDVGTSFIVSKEDSQVSLRLHTSEPRQRADYVTLSYCWGGKQASMLTRSNINSYHEGIDINILPQTIQDSVMIVRDLNIRYLWIDALCILQDSPDDVTKQIKIMGDIYSNATLAIAAARSESAEKGFLDPYHGKPYRTWPDTPGSFEFFEPSILSTPPEPLATRAWAFQEEILSRRILYYGSGGITWHCMSSSCTGKNVHPSHAVDVSWTRKRWKSQDTHCIRSRRQLTKSFYSKDPDTISKPHEMESILHQWYKSAEDYSSRHLTVATDRLPAIAGIATAFFTLQQQTGQLTGTYLAGMWQNDLVSWLAWEKTSTSLATQLISASDIYIAPTWSWASIPHPVKLDHLYKQTAKLEWAAVDLKHSSSPFGPILGASIRLRGRVFDAEIIQTWPSVLRKVEWWISLDHPAKCKQFLQPEDLPRFDYETSRNIIFMELGRMSGSPPKGLVLAADFLPGVFRRIGLYGMSRYDSNEIQDTMDDVRQSIEYRTITII